MAGGTIVSPVLDNRAGCLALLMALAGSTSCENDLYFVFTTQDEVGQRGAKTAAYSIEPSVGISVSTSAAGDTPEAAVKNGLSLGKGAAIKMSDNLAVSNSKIVGLLEKSAACKSMPIQYDTSRSGGTDSGVIQTSRTGVLTRGISIPARYIHTPCGMASPSDVESCAGLLDAFINSLTEISL
jgi:endoglucanase